MLTSPVKLRTICNALIAAPNLGAKRRIQADQVVRMLKQQPTRTKSVRLSYWLIFIWALSKSSSNLIIFGTQRFKYHKNM